MAADRSDIRITWLLSVYTIWTIL